MMHKTVFSKKNKKYKIFYILIEIPKKIIIKNKKKFF